VFYANGLCSAISIPTMQVFLPTADGSTLTLGGETESQNCPQAGHKKLTTRNDAGGSLISSLFRSSLMPAPEQRGRTRASKTAGYTNEVRGLPLRVLRCSRMDCLAVISSNDIKPMQQD